MSQFLFFSGLAQGMLYALVALAFTLIFRAANVATFAIAGVSTFLGFAGFEYVRRGGPGGYVGALVFATVLGGVLGLALYQGLIRRFPAGNLLVLMLVTIGLNFMLIGIAEARYAHAEPYVFPSAFSTNKALVVGVTPQHFAIFVATLGAFGGIYALLNRTRIGLQIRAVAEDVDSARAIGINVNHCRNVTWMVGTALIGLSAVLFAPLLFLDTGTNSLLVSKALAASILGGLNSLPGAVLGGVLLGVIGSFAVPIAPEASNAAVFLVIVVVLFLKPEGLLGRRELRKL